MRFWNSTLVSRARSSLETPGVTANRIRPRISSRSTIERRSSGALSKVRSREMERIVLDTSSAFALACIANPEASGPANEDLAEVGDAALLILGWKLRKVLTEIGPILTT